jgi:hypothetical protein
VTPRYPVYVISKGRAGRCLTARFLAKDGVPFRLVVEPQEEAAYRAEFGDRVAVLPFSNLGQGSIPARNWVMEDSAKIAARHWILDDNISGLYRRYGGRKIPCESNVAFRACEDFVDRYANVAIAGMAYFMFVPNKKKFPPFFQNVHVYSCILVDNGILRDNAIRWRGRYNEDTDLCLQALSAGFCTVLFNAFLAFKMPTMTMKGGNSAELYQGDGRLKMARALESAWPGVVETRRRFGRAQHVVKDNWKQFDQPLVRKADFDFSKLPARDEYGMRLEQVKDVVKSPTVRRLLEENRR